jgi:hypothetical protein
MQRVNKKYPATPKNMQDPVFLLIKSLTKAQKRQFKLYANRIEGHRDSKFIQLFDFFDHAEAYDERELLKQSFVSRTQLANLKSHLYKQLLTSLRLNPSIQNPRMLIREQLDFATVLYQKGLYRQSLKILEKAKQMAKKWDEKYTQYEIVEFEKIIESQYITRSMSNRTEALVSDARELGEANMLCSQLSNLSLLLYERLLKAGYVKSDDEYRDITQFFFRELPKVDYEQLSFRERLWYAKAHVWYSMITQDFLGLFKHASRWVYLFEQYPEMLTSHPIFYLKANNYLMESLLLLRHPEKFKTTLETLRETTASDAFPKNTNTQALAFLYRVNNEMNLHFLKGTFNEGLKLVAEVKEGVKTFENQIDAHHVMMLNYKMACMYFGAANYTQCIAYLRPIIANSSLTMREDLLCFSRILDVIAHFEAGLDDDLDRLLLSTYRFLIRMNDLHQVQRLLIQFIRELGSVYPQDLKEKFRVLHGQLLPLEEDYYERRSFLYLDVLSWLESHISSIPLAEVVAHKNAQSVKASRL